MIKKLIRSAVPRSLRPMAKSIYVGLKLASLRAFASSEFLASVHYAVFSREFRREHRAVLLGRLAYFRSLKDMRKSSALLRRNTHRLEKGLIMRPRREVFAEGFIGETVDCYVSASRVPGFSSDELRWAGDVLETYFSVVGESPVVSDARERFRHAASRCPPASSDDPRRYAPYPLSEAPLTSISLEQIYTLYRRRRSVRWYLERPVQRPLLERLVEAASYAPSACNRQPFRFVISSTPARAVEIAKCAGGTGGFSENLQTIIAVIGDLSAYPEERDRHLIYIDGGLASMQLMLAAETAGLSTCPINWPDVRSAERKIGNLLALPGHERVIMLIAIGYGDPDGQIPFSQKKHSSTLVTYW